jgi:hypothetical protein
MKTTLHTLILPICLLLFLSASARAYYSPEQGRWLSRDPIGEKGGANLYSPFKNTPLQLIDVLGLWATDVHYAATKRWAIAGSYPEQAAEMVGAADEAVDSIGSGTSFWPLAGDQSYHFNRNLNGGPDSRYVHFADQKRKAESLCTIRLGNDFPEMAAVQLGTALHPMQDVVAHGDYGMRMPGIVYIIHNAFSPQRVYGDPTDYPDTTWLDAVGSPDGRPAGSAIHVINNAGFDYAIYAPGIRRWSLTRDRTESVLAGFRSYVKANGGCKCKQFFGVN